MPARLPDPVVGTLFNSWKFLERVDAYYWRCQCVCGKISSIRSSHIKRGASTSCGCSSVRGRKKHGQGGGTKAYQAWKNLKQRCLNPNNDHYPRYGGRGITIDPSFIDDFQAFYLEVGEPTGPDMSINRLNNDLGYVKGNLAWASAIEQQRNKANNRLITYQGTTRTLAEWCNITGIARKTLSARLGKLGWTIAEALEIPTRPDVRTRDKLDTKE